ncbi:putative RNA-binding protein EEED8.10 [Frieseomelitta varia]|nr:putative RNA-binding protein EEED8.10 [Frieseomelitta varia]
MEKTSFTIFTSTTGDGVTDRKIFVSNLARRTTFSDLIKLFSKYGEVKCCFLRRNPGNRNNYALVTFNSLKAAISARNAGRVILHGRNLKILAANPCLQRKNVKSKRKKNVKKHKSKSNKVSNDVTCNQGYRENEISIHKLNDDCLMHIFSHLPIIDRIRIERVCKRWKALIKESWYNMKRLDLRHSMWGSLADRKRKKISLCILREILLRCGSYLNEVDLSFVPYYLHQYTVTLIGKLCRNLEIINITGLCVSRSGIRPFIDNCHNITKLSVGLVTYACDRDLKKLFQMNPKLRYFEAYLTPITGRCLLHLPTDTIEEVVLDCCQYLEEICVLEAIIKLKRIKAFTINECDCISGNIFRFLGTYCKNLETLKICHVPSTSYFLTTDTLHITLLSNLKALTVSENKVITDEFLFSLVTTCQNLTYLDISTCSGISNYGMAAIATFSELEVLIMNDMPRVTKVHLCDASNLKRIECRRSKFMDRVIINLIKSAPQLRVLDLSESLSITNRTLEEAAGITVSRTNNIILKIFVGGTSVDLSTFNNVSPFLQIVIAL